MPKSSGRKALEKIVLSKGLAWLKAQQEDLQTNQLARAVFENPTSSLLGRHEAHCHSKYIAHQTAEAEFNLISSLTRLADVIKQETKKP